MVSHKCDTGSYEGRKDGGWDATSDPVWEVLNDARGEKIETQIRTVLEHGFAEVEHDIRYKPGAAPVTPEVDRQFALTAARLEQADTNIDGIRLALHLGVEGTATQSSRHRRLGRGAVRPIQPRLP